MKKRLYLIAAAAIALVACTKEEATKLTESTIPGAKRIVLGATFELPTDATKSDYDAAGNFYWSSDDAIWIGSDITSGASNWGSGPIISGTENMGPGYATAQFDCTMFGDVTAVAAVFPKTVQPYYASDSLYLTLPKTIAWTATQLENPANATMQVDNIMVARFVDIYDGGYARGTTEDIQFHNVGGLFCLTLKNVPYGAEKLVFTTDKKINGTFTVGDVVEVGEHYPVINTAATDVADEKSTTITFATITNGENKMTFFIPVPVGSYVIGFDVQDGEGNSLWNFSASKANGVERGHIVKMPTLSHVIVGGSGAGATNIITTPTGFSGDVPLPSTLNNIYVRMNETDGTINLKYSADPALHPANVYIQALGDVNTLNINLPDSHVELTGEDSVQHVITNVSSYTSFSTLKVDNKVKIGKAEEENSGITITGGSLDIAAPVAGTVKVDIPETVLNTTENKVSINITNTITNLNVKQAANQEAANKIYVTIAQVAEVKDSLAVPETNCNLYVAKGAKVKVIETKAAENTVEGKVETLAASGESTVVTVTKAGSVTEAISSADKATVVIENRTQEEVAAGTAGEIVSGDDVTTKTEGSVITVDGTVVAYIGSTPYITLDAAIEAAEAGATITIFKDITNDHGYNLSKSLVIDLNGKTITFNGVPGNGRTYTAQGYTQSRAFKITGSADFTLKNGTVALNEALLGSVRFDSTGTLTLQDYTTNNSRGWGLNIKLENGTAVLNNVTIDSEIGGGIEVNGPATATMNNCTLTQTGVDSESWISTAVGVAYNGQLTINGGSFTGTYATYIYSSGGTLNVTDGTFVGTENAIVLATDKSTYPNGSSTVNVAGGKFSGSYSVQAGDVLSITGGTFDHDPSAYVADGYIANGSNPWTVIKRAGAVTNLAELQEAITNNVTPIYYVGEAITEAFTLAPSVATTINGLKVNHQTVAANATTITINGDVTLNEADIISKAYCAVSVAAEKTVTLKDCIVDASTAAADNSHAMNINAGSTVTIDGSTVKGSATAGYSRCINVLDEGAHIEIVNGSVLSVSHYAINLPSSAVNAVINVNGSSVNTGWAITNIWKTGNTITFTNCTLNSVNDKTYDKDGWNDFSAFVFNNDGTNISTGNVVTVNNCAVSVSSTKGNRQSLISMRGNGDTIKFIGADGTISLAENGGITYQWGQLHSVLNNTLSFDDANYVKIEENIDAACIVTTANNLHTITYVTEVYYYWDTDNGQQGSYCSLADPIVKGWISNNEYIRLEKNVTLTANLTVALSQYLTADHFFTLTFGNYSITKGEYSIILPAGLSVKTDKQTTVFTAAEGAEIEETVENNVYTYTAEARNYVAQIGEVKYESLADAIAAVPTDGTETTITMIGDASLTAGITIANTKNVVLELAGHTISEVLSQSGTTALITNDGTLTIQDNTDSQANGSGQGKITYYNGNPDMQDSPGYASNTIANHGNLTLKSGYVDNTTNGGYAAYTVDNQTNGGLYTPVFTMNGGKVHNSCTDAVRMFLNSTSKLNKVVINGGIIDSQKEGRIVVIQNANAHLNKGEFDMTGGVVTKGVGGWSSIEPDYYYSDEQYGEISINITGGQMHEFITTYFPKTAARANALHVTGGIFEVDPSDYVSAGYEAYQEDNVWKIREATGPQYWINYAAASYESVDETNKVITIANAAQLAKLAKDVRRNESTNYQQVSNFEGYTIRLVADIDLSGKIWFPIGADNTWSPEEQAVPDANPCYNSWFRGTFDGNGKTIRNMHAVHEENAGLFGCAVYATFTNIKVEDFEIESNHFAGGVIAWIEVGANAPSITNCTVKNGTITSSPVLVGNAYDNGDKVGGICGFLYTGANRPVAFSGNTVENVNITAYRDFGGLLGYGNYATVSDNTVKNVNLYQNNTNAYKSGTITTFGPEIGRNENNTSTASNNILTNVKMYTGVPGAYTEVISSVAQIGNTGYESLAAAIAAVPADGTETTIQMLADETMATGATLEVASTKNIVLDLNGKTVTGNGGVNGANFFFLTNRGVLEITDSSSGQNGKITGYWTNPNTGWGNQFNTIYNIDGKLTLSAGTVETTTGYLSYAINNSSNAWGVGDDKETVFTMTGGTVTAPSGDAAVRVYQNCGSNSNPYSHNTVNISGGLIKDTGMFIDTYIYKANPASSGDHINTTINISGGEIHGLIDLKMRHPYNTTVNVTGGSFRSSTLRVRKYVSEWGTGLAEPTEPVFNISNGDFQFSGSSSSDAFAVIKSNEPSNVWTSYANQYSITGGTFNVDPSDYVSAGYEAYQEDNVWKIREIPGVAKIGTTNYPSLKAAVEAANSGDTITIIADDDISLTDGSELELSKQLTITGAVDAQGNPLYTIYGKSDVTGTNDIFISGSGNVTLQNIKIKNFGNNKDTDSGHAPLYVSTNYTGTVSLNNVYVSDFNRGGIFLYGGSFNVDNCYIDCANSRSGAFTKGIEIKGSANGTIANTFICNMERSSATYSSAGIEIYGNGSIVVDNCTIVSDDGNHQSVKATYGIVSNRVGEHNPSGGSATIKECMFVCTNACLSVADSDAYGPVNNYSFTVTDCDFNNYIATWSTTSSITINSGSFAEDVYADAGTIIIHNGEFSNFLPDTGTNGSVIIDGGIFDADPTQYLAANYKAEKQTEGEYEGKWVVMLNDTITIGGADPINQPGPDPVIPL